MPCGLHSDFQQEEQESRVPQVYSVAQWLQQQSKQQPVIAVLDIFFAYFLRAELVKNNIHKNGHTLSLIANAMPFRICGFAFFSPLQLRVLLLWQQLRQNIWTMHEIWHAHLRKSSGICVAGVSR